MRPLPDVRGGPAAARRARRVRGAVVAAVVAALTALLAGCGSSQPPAVHGRIAYLGVPGPPFGIATTGRYAFVDLLTGRVLVLSDASFPPRVIHTIPVPARAAVGSSLTRDGRYLLLAGGQGATVVSVARAERGAPGPVLGTLRPPAGAHLRAAGAIETNSSADGRYVFVSLEYGSPGGVVAVYDLGPGPVPRFGPSDYVGAITLGDAVVGSARSPDGRYLYVTSEVGRHSGDGTVSVISIAMAEHDPARAVLATVPAMQQPVRVAVSPDGSVVWVTARASDRLLAFSARRLLSDGAHALLADVKVGTAPVGLALFDGGRRVVVADSDRFNAPGAHSGLTIVNAVAALAHRPAVIATLPAGQFPREMSVEPNGRVVLVGNFGSGTLEAVKLATRG
jgi:YVTN family beta-propeller protein